MTIAQSMMLSLKSLKHSVRPQLKSGWQRWLSISLRVWGCAAIAVVSPSIQAAPKSTGFVINGSQVNDYSGLFVSNAGDVNGDGIPDLIVGARSADPNGKISAGRSYVVFGKRNARPVELGSLESGTSQAGFVINGSQASDRSGTSVSSAGDINGDGLTDLIVGAPGDFFYFASPGRSYVVFGKRDGTPVELATIENGTSPDGFVINGSKAGDLSGFSVSKAGDVNGDGLADVIVGAFYADPTGRFQAGRSYVVFGKRDGIPVELATIESGTSQAGFVINGSNAFDYSGGSVSNAGDINGDGLDDVIVGAVGADPNGISSAGRSYIVLGKRNTQPVELSTLEGN